MSHCLDANWSKMFYKPFLCQPGNLEHFQRNFLQTPYLWQCYLRQSMLLEYSHPKGIFVCPTRPTLPVLYPWHTLRLLHNPVTEHTYHDLLCSHIKYWDPNVTLKTLKIMVTVLPYVSLTLTCKIPYVHSILLPLCQKRQILLKEAKN